MKYFLLLSSILLLSSCAVNPTSDQNNPEPMNVVSTEQEVRLGRILHDQALQQLGETQPEAYVLYQQAHAAEAQGDLTTAIELYHKSMQQAPENGLLLTSLGLAYLRIEDTIPARRYLLKAVRYDPGYYKPKLGLGYIYLQGQKLQKAVIQLEDSLQLLATVEGTFLLGKAKEAQGDLSRARQLYQTVVQVDGNGKLGKAAATLLRSLPR
jgi:tetratricopeptide (TPR) repeat protein